MMPRKVGASALIAHSDSSLRSARDLAFLPPVASRAFVVGSLVLQNGERPPSLLRPPFLVPLWAVSVLALRGVMSFGGVAP